MLFIIQKNNFYTTIKNSVTWKQIYMSSCILYKLYIYILYIVMYDVYHLETVRYVFNYIKKTKYVMVSQKSVIAADAGK
jgi:hypothetical protein